MNHPLPALSGAPRSRRRLRSRSVSFISDCHRRRSGCLQCISRRALSRHYDRRVYRSARVARSSRLPRNSPKPIERGVIALIADRCETIAPISTHAQRTRARLTTETRAADANPSESELLTVQITKSPRSLSRVRSLMDVSGLLTRAHRPARTHARPRAPGGFSGWRVATGTHVWRPQSSLSQPGKLGAFRAGVPGN